MELIPRHHRSALARTLAPFIVVAVLALAWAGCAQRKDRSHLLHGVATDSVRLECVHTGVQDMRMIVPRGYAIEWTEQATYDNFFVYVPGDTGEVQRAMAVIDVMQAPSRVIPDSMASVKVIGRIGENDVDWRERTVVDSTNGSKLYQREMVSREVLHGKDAAHNAAGLVLHVFLVGSDEQEVERLAASIETLRPIAMKPNL